MIGGEARPPPPPGEDADDDLLTRQEASAYLLEFHIRMKPATLARAWSVGSDGPPCQHIRGKPFYPRGDLRAWARSQQTNLRRSRHEGDRHGPRDRRPGDAERT